MRALPLVLGLLAAQLAMSLAGCSRKAIRSRSIDSSRGKLESCTEPNIRQCEALRIKIDELTKDRDEAVADHDMTRMASLTLDINQFEEHLRLLSSGRGSSENLTKLRSKYAALREILDQEMKDSSPRFTPEGEKITSLPVSLYDRREANVIAQVMGDFGDLYVRDSGQNPDGSPKWEELKLETPWAGYWFPLQGQSLFGDDQSPLVKLDKLAAKRNQSTHAAALESVQTSLAQEGWEGRCAAWAMASILSKEPESPRQVDGMTFTIRDQKALLTKIFELYPSRTYGIRYDGNDSTDGTFQDIRPEALHRIFLHQLGDQKRHFLIDEASGIEIWSKPVYRMRWTVQPDPDHPRAFKVIAQPWLIKHRNDESETPTTQSDRSSPEWTYRLYYNPNDQKGDLFRVIAGEWLGHSRDHHPDTITIPIPGKDPKSSNLEINKVMNLVREIVPIDGR